MNFISTIIFIIKVIIFVFLNLITLAINDLMIIINSLLSLFPALSGLVGSFLSVVTTVIMFTGDNSLSILLLSPTALVVVLAIWRLKGGGKR